MKDAVGIEVGRGESLWCLSCGKWMFRCQCRAPLPYCYAADITTAERRATLTLMHVNDGQGRIYA